MINIFFRDAILNLNPEATQQAVKILTEAVHKKRLSDALLIAIRSFINELVGDYVFINRRY